MATVDRAVGDLQRATELNGSDLLVIEQDGVAKSLPGSVMVSYVMHLFETVGAIQKIEKIGSDVLIDNYRITFSDGSYFDYSVSNGRGISNFSKSNSDGLVDTYIVRMNDETEYSFTVTNGKTIVNIVKGSTNGLVDTYYVNLNDGSRTTFDVSNGKGIVEIKEDITVGLLKYYKVVYNDGTTSDLVIKNGEKGEPGKPARVWIRYASQEPTEESPSFGELPDDWMGVASGDYDVAPLNWKNYTWYKIRGDSGKDGEKGDVGMTPQFSIGNVSTLEPDERASVSISGSAEFPRLNFSIPRGKDGADGTYSADWDVNDYGAPGYIVGRTHYVKSKQSTIVSDRISFVNNEADISVTINASNFLPIVVDWNGILYRCEMRNVSHLQGDNIYAFGNLNLVDSSYSETSEPFVFIYNANTASAIIKKTTEDNPILFTLYYGEVVRKLDNKYLDADWVPKRTRVGLDGIVYPEQNVTFTNGQTMLHDIPEGAIAAQCRYRVKFGSTVYDAVCYVDDDGGLGIGNSALAGLSKITDHPFYISSYGGSAVLMYQESTASTEVSVSIVGLETYVYNTLPVEYLPGGDSSAQPNWNAPEGKLGHILNRTHWIEGGYTYVLPETNASGSSGTVYSVPVPINILLDTTYIIKLNQTEYTTTPYERNGHLALGDWSTSFPFLLEVFTDSTIIQLINAVESLTISVKTGTPEKYHPLDPRFIPDGIAAEADWNAKEGEPGHVKNRTHWAESTVYADGEYTSSYSSSYGCFMISVNDDLDAIPGNMSVVFDGVEYSNLKSAKIPDMGYVFGNLSLLNAVLGTAHENTGEPFVVGVSTRGMALMLATDTVSTKHTLRVMINETIHKLPCKYLPEGVPYCEKKIFLGETDAAQVTHPSYGKVWIIEKGLYLTIEETYTVTYNGVDYECTANPMPDGYTDNPDAVALGNFSIIGGANTGEPFGMMVSPGATGIIIMDLVGSTSVSVGIARNIISKLDNRLLDMDWIPKVSKRVLIPEVTVTSGTEAQNDGSYFSQVKFAMGFSIPNGTEIPLIMVVDGVEYSAVGTGTMDGTAVDCPAVGLTFVHISDNYQFFGSTEPATTYTVSVYDPAGYEYEKMPEYFLPESVDGVVIRSSTAGSTKKFLLTVDDSGTLTVTEVTE